MKILIDLTALADNFSGIERYAACIAYEMIKQSEAEYILLFKEEVHPLFSEIVGMRNVESIILARCNKLLFNQIRLPLAIHKLQADWYLFLAFPVPVLTFKKNVISTIHDICCWDCPETMNGLSKWYFRISHRIAMWKCKKIVTISEFSKKRIIERLRYPESNILLVYCGIGEQFSDSADLEKNYESVKTKYQLPNRYILSLSTLEPRKNVRLLIEAYQYMYKEQKIDIPIVLAGRKGWKMDALLEGLDADVRDNIYITGFVEDVDLPYIYRNAECFVFPSMYEGFGIPPLEAIACGVPVLSSDAASLPEVLGDAALYFENGNMNDLQRALNRVVTMSIDEKETLYKNGTFQVKKFQWSREAQVLYNHLCQIDKR